MSIYYNAKIHDSLNLPNIYYDGNVTLVNDGGYTYSDNGYRIYIDPTTLLYTETPYISFETTGFYDEDCYALLKFKHNTSILNLEGIISTNYTSEIISINRIIGLDSYESIVKVYATSGNTTDDIEFKIYPIVDGEDLFIYDIEIYNFDITAGSYEIYLSTRDDVEIDGNTAIPYLLTPKKISSSIDPSESKASTSSINLDIINRNYEISQLIYERINNTDVMFWNEKVEVWQNINGEEKRIFLGTIRDIRNDPFEGSYSIECADIFDRLKVKLFSREFAIYEYLGVTETQYDINTYRLPYYDDGGERKGFYYREDFRPDSGDSYLVIEFFGTAMDFIEMTLQLIFTNPALEIGAPWLTNDWKEYIDIESFEEIKTILSGALYENFYFAFVEPLDNPFDYVREQILKPCRIFPYINDEGKLGLKIHQQPTEDEGIVTFTEDNIIKVIEKKNSISDFVNHIMIMYDKNWFDDAYATSGNQQDEFSTVLYSMQSTSVQKNRFLSPKKNPLTFEVEGINDLSTSNKNLFAQNIVDSYFSRYSESITEITIQSNIYFTGDVTVGDYVGLSHNHLVDWKGDNQGSTYIGYTNNLEIDDYPDTTVRLNTGDVWGGFIYNNRLGYSITGDIVLNTQSDEIQSELFTGDSYSCKTNHQNVTEWLNSQGVY